MGVQEFLRCAMDQLHRELCEPVLEEEEEQIIKSEEGGGHIESMSEVDSASSATGSEVGGLGQDWKIAFQSGLLVGLVF